MRYALLVLILSLFGCVTVKQAGLFCLGALSAGVVHEGSHLLVAKATGRDIGFHGLKWGMVEGESDTALQMAGLVGNAVTSEVALAFYDGETGFAEGLIAANTFEEMTYPVLRGATDDFHGHVHHADGWRAGFVTHGASVAVRAAAKKLKTGWSFGVLPFGNGGVVNFGFRW